MLTPRRGCVGYSKVYCDVRKRWFLAWNQNRHITYYIINIQYTNSKISIFLLYIYPHFVWWHCLNHCAALVRNLPTSISVRASVNLLTFHTSFILAPSWFTNFEHYRFQNISISTLSSWLVLPGMVEAVEQQFHFKFSSCFRLLKTKIKKNVAGYVLFCFGNYMIRWWGFQSNQMIKPMKQKIQFC